VCYNEISQGVPLSRLTLTSARNIVRTLTMAHQWPRLFDRACRSFRAQLSLHSPLLLGPYLPFGELQRLRCRRRTCCWRLQGHRVLDVTGDLRSSDGCSSSSSSRTNREHPVAINAHCRYLLVVLVVTTPHQEGSIKVQEE
jgi:hypothetical protein